MQGPFGKKLKPSHMAVTGAYFGGFQALMPLIGYILGKQFEHLITSIDHWIAFILLAVIGANMIKESRSKADNLNDLFTFKAMFPLAIATSIDALAVGISLAFLGVDIISSVIFIGITTFILSAVGVWIGNAFGSKYKSPAEMVGGIVLIIIGLKILFEHLNIISF